MLVVATGQRKWSGKNFFKVREKSGNVTLSQVKFESWKEVREKGNFKSVYFIYVHNVHILLMKMNDKLMLGFQENQTFLHVLSRNCQFMYTACDLLKV